MAGLNEVKVKIAQMSRGALNMWRHTYQAFMEHDLDLLAGVLDEENRLNTLEKEITQDLVGLMRGHSQKEEAQAAIYADIVGDLELIGDYCKDILERVQIKIEEKLLFSEEAVIEFSELYQKAERALEEVASALEQDKPCLAGEVLKGQGHIDNLVDACRKRHNQRLAQGICSPLACNMFLNMLDFTAAVYYHTKKIAKSLLKIKI